MRAPSWSARFVGAAIVATSLALPGCGPGVGGTGTGGAALTAFGATAASVCSSAVALELGCAQAPAPSSGVGSSAGTLPVQLVDAAGRVTLDVSGNSATLASSCLQLRFDGDFGRGAAGEGFFGSFRVAGGTVDVIASLAAAPAPGGGLTVELRDLDGNVVLAPVVLHRATVRLPSPNAC
jgi:hypothetical protein